MYHFSLIPKENIYSIIALLKILNPVIDEQTLKSRLDEMLTQGYECVGVYDGDKLIGISGLWIITKYYVGKHIEPDNVVIHPDYRNKGIGELLMQWIYDYGRYKGCVASELNCYVINEKGHKFWFNEGYKILGFHFQKKL
ncbi:MAG: GNAT family N-acetyltransferase [Fimbriimonadaceae bacterium]|nr:GNAT family N-acetyltransferase [Chitinophagales bacterium]